MGPSSLDSAQSRKWQITINNPLEHGFTRDVIESTLSKLRGNSLYWCFCDEEGDECETLHTHIFLYRRSPFTARQLQGMFPDCHREICHGTPKENRAYILKDGPKFNKQPDGHYEYTDDKGKCHAGINYSETFRESGPCPEEHQGVSSSTEVIVDLVRRGATNLEILEVVPSAYRDLEKIDYIRTLYRDDEYKRVFRKMTVTYIYGRTGAGKTRYVTSLFEPDNVYRVTDYKNPFDHYEGEDVLVLDEFRSGLSIELMLNVLDGYRFRFPCRYHDRQACHTQVYLISNIPIENQYPRLDVDTREAWLRRIHWIIDFRSSDNMLKYEGYEKYRARHAWSDSSDRESDVLPF